MNADITIWDNDFNRTIATEKNLRLAMQDAGMKGTIHIMSEPPLLSRMGMLNKVPVLEISGLFWSLKPGCEISFMDCQALLRIAVPANETI